ncbi:MAG: CHAT domain-containing protein, partial [Anaerolineae bacterium]
LSVQEALGTGRYDVIHYAGHARFGDDDGEESALELAQGRVLPASQIERGLRGTPLVFLNACSSAQADLQETAHPPLTYLGAAAESLAAAFIFGGAQGFIGALWPVLDAGSRRFAAFFYDRALAGDPVGEALRATRQRLHQERPADPTWASFVLYGDPTYRLWAGPATTEPKKAAVPAGPARRTGAARSVPPPRISSRAAPSRPQTPAQQRDGRLRLLAGVFVFLVVAGLLSAFGWWAYGRVSGTSRPAPAVTPVALAAAVRTLTPTASVTPSSVATSTPRPPTSTSTAAPTGSPTAQPTVTPAVVQLPRGRLAFVSKVSPDKSTLYVMQADGSGLQALGLGVDPDWSPAADRIAFAGLLEDEPGIHLINADGSGRVRLTDASDWQPTWSPDGQRLAFMSLRDGNREIYVVNTDGSGLRRISNNPWQDKHPSWSPAGNRIAFISNRSGRWQVWVMNADGSQQVRLTDNDFDNFRPVWSPDGRQIACGVWTGVRNEIWVMDADGSNPHLVTANAVYKQEFAGYGLAWSPNRFISFVSNRAGQPQVYAMNPDGSGQTAVTEMPAGAFSPAWTPR